MRKGTWVQLDAPLIAKKGDILLINGDAVTIISAPVAMIKEARGARKGTSFLCTPPDEIRKRWDDIIDVLRTLGPLAPDDLTEFMREDPTRRDYNTLGNDLVRMYKEGEIDRDRVGGGKFRGRYVYKVIT